MTSSSNQTVPKPEEHKTNAGLNLLGYTVPWWVVLLVIAVLVYVAYDNNLLKDVLGPSNQVIRASGSNIDVGSALDVETPAQIRRFMY
jgi:hypothetical protein